MLQDLLRMLELHPRAGREMLLRRRKRDVLHDRASVLLGTVLRHCVLQRGVLPAGASVLRRKLLRGDQLLQRPMLPSGDNVHWRRVPGVRLPVCELQT